jgi:thioredoxin-related protein
MKKIAITLFVFLFCFVSTRAQKINYESSLEKAEQRSRTENKILCILVTIQPPAYVPEILTGLKDPAITSKFNESFINYKIDRSDSASVPIIKKHRLTGFPVFVFVDSKGGTLFMKVGNMPPPMLSDMLEKAIAESKQKSMVDYDEQYKSGDRSKAFLTDYINKRISAGITANADLAEEYVNTLYVKELNDYKEVLFILKAGPFIDGRANTLLNTNRKLVDSVFKTELYDLRVAINTRMSDNTMASAIATRNINRARAVVNLTRWSWQKDDPLLGQRNADGKMLQYYMGIKDTMGYLRQASMHFDRYYMQVSADSIRRLNEKNEERARSNANEQALLSKPAGATIRTVGYAFAANDYATQLNNGAWSVFAMRTKDPAFLTKAMLWSKRSIELNPASFNYDTLAHLQYRLGLYSEAEATQEKAIELGKTEKRDIRKMQEELAKIKKRAL